MSRASREGSRRGGKFNKNKRRDKERGKRGEREKNKERIYREGGRALTNSMIDKIDDCPSVITESGNLNQIFFVDFIM